MSPISETSDFLLASDPIQEPKDLPRTSLQSRLLMVMMVGLVQRQEEGRELAQTLLTKKNVISMAENFFKSGREVIDSLDSGLEA